jgi:hypothetical protein
LGLENLRYNKEELLHHASELGERLSALEVVGKSKMHKDFVVQMQRQEKAQDKQKDKETIVKPKQSKDHEPDREL